MKKVLSAAGNSKNFVIIVRHGRWHGQSIPCSRKISRLGPTGQFVFHQHKGHFTVSEQNISQKLLSPEGLTGDQKDTIDKVLEHYGDWEPYELRERSHDEDPWKNARGGIPEDAPSCQVISKESMGEYYGSL